MLDAIDACNSSCHQPNGTEVGDNIHQLIIHMVGEYQNKSDEMNAKMGPEVDGG